MNIEILTESTKESGELYLLINDDACLVPFNQKYADEGRITMFPDFEDNDEDFTPPLPFTTDEAGVFVYWYTFYYLMAGKNAPPSVEAQYLKNFQ